MLDGEALYFYTRLYFIATSSPFFFFSPTRVKPLHLLLFYSFILFTSCKIRPLLLIVD